MLRKRPFLTRLWRSYRAHRAYLGPIESARGAWILART